MTATRPARHSLATAFSWLLIVFLVLFPKGGVKIGILPLTWGYLLLAAAAPVLVLIRVLTFPLRIQAPVLRALLLLLPMQLVTVYSYVEFGVAVPAYAASMFVSLFVLPPLFLLVYSSFLPLLDGQKLAKYLRNCMLLAALWGILLFIQYPLTGHITEIPYLTVNAQDAGLIEATKHISRGPFLKLISTYNNGNLYGAATLLLLPLYDRLEPSRWRRAVIKIALLLTLSRTVWFGLVFNESVPLLALLCRQLPTFPIVRFAGTGRRIVAIGITICLVLVALLFISGNATLAFLFDPNGGGRLVGLSGLTLSILPTSGPNGFAEVIYLSALQEYGVVGLLAITLLMVSPVVLLLWDRRPLQSPLRRDALRGLIVYSVVALSDCGFNFIPIMAFYWFVYMIYLFGWPAFAPVQARVRTPRGRSLPIVHAGRQAIPADAPAMGRQTIGRQTWTEGSVTL